jgi:hypothetical protein
MKCAMKIAQTRADILCNIPVVLGKSISTFVLHAIGIFEEEHNSNLFAYSTAVELVN